MIGNDWDQLLKEEYQKPYFVQLLKFIDKEYQNKIIMPPKEQVFLALKQTPFSQVRVVILGQDPYPEINVANGLAFSASDNVATPKSLVNIKKLLEIDLGIKKENNSLDSWSEQGVLLLNAVLTVEANKVNSHRNLGWEKFTDQVIKILNKEKKRLIFVLLGRQAQQKKDLIDEKHIIIMTSHPSPLSAHRGFMRSKLFSQINQLLDDKITW